ncbi:unnamed protein product, partial [Amoebophrya sp. A25]|eukprot:GSA25T00020028001.1
MSSSSSSKTPAMGMEKIPGEVDGTEMETLPNEMLGDPTESTSVQVLSRQLGGMQVMKEYQNQQQGMTANMIQYLTALGYKVIIPRNKREKTEEEDYHEDVKYHEKKAARVKNLAKKKQSLADKTTKAKQALMNDPRVRRLVDPSMPIRTRAVPTNVLDVDGFDSARGLSSNMFLKGVLALGNGG